MKKENRPWGWFIKIFERRNFWLKFIFVRGRTSLQSHCRRSELHLGTRGINFIRRLEKHRLEKGIYLELAFGESDENDIVRYEDDYGRISAKLQKSLGNMFMKLLIITQKVDINDDVLGFFHGWIEEFARHYEKIIVICLQKGEYHLPSNVRILSLGKEKFINNSHHSHAIRRLVSLYRFYKYIWQERKNYDTVFVHMNQEYVLLGWFPWKVLGKKIALWRNHYAGNLFTRAAMMFSDHIFCTSKYSFTAKSKKTTLMPVGIDTNLFKKENNSARKHNSILFLARISPVKKPHLVIEALRHVCGKGVDFTADFYGNPLPQDVSYLDSLKEKVKDYQLSDRISFKKGIPNREAPRVYNSHEIFVNPSPSGMYDKTIFEAMACESLVLTSNINLKGKIDEGFLFMENDEEDLAKQSVRLLALPLEEKEELGKILRAFVVSHHSLTILGGKLAKCLAS